MEWLDERLLWTTYLAKVDELGGWEKYHQAHRKRLTTTFASKFPRVPLEVVSQIVDFSFHVGFYEWY